jgi:hypothetical protein
MADSASTPHQPGRLRVRNYFRAGYADELSDAMIEVVLEHGSQLPSPMSAVHIHQMGGAVGRVAAEATAFGNRGAAFAYNLVSTWTDAREDEQHIHANRAFAAALEPMSTGGRMSTSSATKGTPGSEPLTASRRTTGLLR